MIITLTCIRTQYIATVLTLIVPPPQEPKSKQNNLKRNYKTMSSCQSNEYDNE